MPEPLPLQVQIAPFPANFTPVDLNTFASALAARISLTPYQEYALFVTGNAEPATNVGPWLKENGDGTRTWYLWDDNTGNYVSTEGTDAIFSAQATNASTLQDNATWTTLNAFQTELLDTAGIYDPPTSTAVFTSTTAGLWEFNTRFLIAKTSGNNTASIQIRFQTSGGRTVYETVAYSITGTNASTTIVVDVTTPPVQMTAGEDITIQGYMTSVAGSTYTVNTTSTNGGHFSGKKLR